MRSFIFFKLACLAFAGLVFADPLLSPQEAVKKMTVPPGFSVDILASEPDLVQPVAFAWDSRGRIYVVEARTYPQRRGQPPSDDHKPGESLTKPTEAQWKDIFGGDDTILIFEDKDGDGTFETRKVFVEHLNLVSGIEVGDGGIFIGAAPYLLFIPDKDGDDKPDGPPEMLLDGWGWQDTHETLNSFSWGPDGWLYGCHGVFTHSNVGTPGTPKEKRTPLNCAYWRYHPVTKAFDIYAHGTSNAWGFDYNASGDWFSEACVIPHFWHIIQGGYYLRQSNPLGHFNPFVYTNIETIADHQHYIGATPHGGNSVSDAAGGGHAHCGLCIYNGDNFPPEYRGRPLFFNIHGQRINQENLVPQGSGYVAKHLPDFLRANDKNFTGVALKVGPDGAVYFIDWYDQQKCHLPQKERWDRSNGRLYRVKYDSAWKPWKGDMAKQSFARTLKDAGRQDWAGRTARRLLAEGSIKPVLEEDYEAVKQLKSSVLDPLAPDDPAAAPAMIANLWAAFGAGLISDKEAAEQVSWDNPFAGGHFQAAVLRHLADRNALHLVSADRLVKLAQAQSSGTLRLALASALQSLPLDGRWPVVEALIRHEEDASDHNLPQMYWYAIEPLVQAQPERALELAAKSAIPLVSLNVMRRLGESEGGVDHLISAVAKEKTGSGLVFLLKAASDGLKGRVGVSAPAKWEAAFRNIDEVLAHREDARALSGQIEDLRTSLAVSFGDRRAFPSLRQQVGDTKQPIERRELALQVLVQGKDPELGNLVLRLLDDPAMRLAALKALPQAVETLSEK